MPAISPLTRTLLSLERFSQIIGVTPPHFWGAKGETYFPDINDCNGIFWHYYWQSQDNVSRTEIANAIKEAEDDITRIIGYSPAPHWIEDEVKMYSRHYRRDVYSYGMQDVRGMQKAVKINEGKFIEGGRRAVSVVTAGVAVVYSDEDGDGYDETATITTATTLTNACEIKCYIAGEGGDADWEIRQPRSVTIAGGNVTFVYWAWQLLDPDLQQAFPTSSGISPIDLEAAASYVATVDVYREYNDFTQASCQLLWERIPVINAGLNIIGFCCESCGGAGCPACEFVAQDGCIHVKDSDGTFVVPQPATYDSTDGQWERAIPSVCRDPDLIKVWYYAGDFSQKYLAQTTCDPLSDWWAQTITWLAVARVNRPFCTCNNSLTLLNDLQRDLSFVSSRDLGTFTISSSDLDNPLGTRAGEVKAWKRINRISSAIGVGGAV